MVEWKEYTVADVISTVIDYRGKTPKKLGGDWSDSGYRALSAKNIKTGKIVQVDSIRYVSEEMYKCWMKEEVQKEDILITSEAPFGQIYYWDSDEKIVLSQRLFAVRVNQLFYPKYIYFYMTSSFFQAELDGRTTGTTVVGLRQPELLKCKIYAPNYQEQKRIADTLWCLEQKINNNEAINNNLLEQLNQLYTEFSTRSDWSEMTIGDVAVKVAMGPFGSNIKVSTFVEYGVPIISGNHLRGYFLEEPSYNYITEEHAEKLKNSIVYPKDIIFTHAGNIGQVAMIPDGCEFPYYVLSQRQFYLRCNTELVVPEYVLLFFHSKKGQHELLSYANQTGVPSIAQPATNLKKIRLPIPSLDEQKDWLSVVTPLITMYQNNYQETKRLASLRDTLLPKLMSGGIDVSNLEL